MKIHEFQAKSLLREYGVLVPKGYIALKSKEAVEIASKMHMPVVVKAQIHAGGRGKVGGVKVVKLFKDVESTVEQILGKKMVTNQTNSEGQRVRKVLIEQGYTILKELFLSFVIDRSNAKVLLVASKTGGVNIESLADEDPTKISRIKINPLIGIKQYHCQQLVDELDIPKKNNKDFFKIVTALYKMLVDLDCSLIEINPLAITSDDQLIALDAKIAFDSNALYRHKNLLKMRDTEEEDFFEYKASQYNLNYINLGNDGNIGSMVNGAGLAMATMDIIKRAGGKPANFLDVGGGANIEMVENGFKIILSNKNIRGILINIFGGILRCDTLAEGVIKAAKNIKLELPVVIRMEGTNVNRGRKILKESDFKFITATDLKDAAFQISKMVIK